MGASVVTPGAVSCNNCCSDEGRGQLTFRGDGLGSSIDEVRPEIADPLSESMSPDAHVAASPVLPPQPDSPGGSFQAGAAALTGAHSIFSQGARAASSANRAGSSADTNSDQSVADGQDSAASTDVDGTEQRLTVERLVRGLFNGMSIMAVAANGNLVECTLAVNREMTTISLQRANVKGGRKLEIGLGHIQKVTPGSEVEGYHELPLDDNCVAFYLKDGQMMAFSFPDIEERLNFMRCLSTFVGDNVVFAGGHEVSFKVKQPKAIAAAQASAAAGELPACGSFGLEDPDNISVPDCQETFETFAFEVDARAAEVATG